MDEAILGLPQGERDVGGGEGVWGEGVSGCVICFSLHEVKRWWLGLSAASRFSISESLMHTHTHTHTHTHIHTAIIAVNGAVFALWRVRPLTSLMERYFVSSITQREMIRVLCVNLK